MLSLPDPYDGSREAKSRRSSIHETRDGTGRSTDSLESGTGAQPVEDRQQIEESRQQKLPALIFLENQIILRGLCA